MTTDFVPARSATNGFGGLGAGATGVESFALHQNNHRRLGAGAGAGVGGAGVLLPELGMLLLGFCETGQSEAASNNAANSWIVGMGVVRALRTAVRRDTQRGGILT